MVINIEPLNEIDFEDWCILLDHVRTSFTIIDRMLLNLVRKQKLKTSRRPIKKIKKKKILSISKNIIENVMAREEQFEIIPRGEFKNIFRKKTQVQFKEPSNIPPNLEVVGTELLADLFEPLT